MAKKVETIVTLTDDLDGGKADQTVVFGFDGTSYEIDLSKRNANAFEKVLRPYVAAARKAGRSTRTARARRPQTSSSGSRRRDLAAIREWAKAAGLEVSDRGRIAASVIEQYDVARS